MLSFKYFSNIHVCIYLRLRTERSKVSPSALLPPLAVLRLTAEQLQPRPLVRLEQVSLQARLIAALRLRRSWCARAAALHRLVDLEDGGRPLAHLLNYRVGKHSRI